MMIVQLIFDVLLMLPLIIVTILLCDELWHQCCRQHQSSKGVYTANRLRFWKNLRPTIRKDLKVIRNRDIE